MLVWLQQKINSEVIGPFSCHALFIDVVWGHVQGAKMGLFGVKIGPTLAGEDAEDNFKY